MRVYFRDNIKLRAIEAKAEDAFKMVNNQSLAAKFIKKLGVQRTSICLTVIPKQLKI